MKIESKHRLIETLDSISELLVKCGGRGGKPGPCPRNKPEGSGKPSSSEAERKRRVQSVHARFATALSGAKPKDKPKKQPYGGKTHTVKLPKDPKKLTIQLAGKAMDQMGHKMKLAPYDLKKKKAMYHVEFANGTKKTIDSDEVKKIVYAGHADN